MTEIMIDSNVLIDIFNQDRVWFDWSASTVEKYAEQSNFIINPIIYGEISLSFEKIEELEELLYDSYFIKESIPYEAAFLASRVFLKYRRNGGKRNSLLPDFLIGAHAAVRAIPLLTRDPSGYKTYYPTLKLISPEDLHSTN